MSNPRFPDPFGRRELLEPGATASGGGLSLEQRIAALEQGAAARPGPGVTDGSLLVSDDALTGRCSWVAPSTVRLTRTSNQSIANWTSGEPPSVTFTAETWDDGALAAIGTTDDRITFPSAAKYRISGGCELAANATGARILFVKRYNSSNAVQEAVMLDSAAGTTATNFGVTGSVDMQVSAGDYIKLQILQNSGGALNITAGNGTYSAIMSAHRIA